MATDEMDWEQQSDSEIATKFDALSECSRWEDCSGAVRDHREVMDEEQVLRLPSYRKRKRCTSQDGLRSGKVFRSDDRVSAEEIVLFFCVRCGRSELWAEYQIRDGRQYCVSGGRRVMGVNLFGFLRKLGAQWKPVRKRLKQLHMSGAWCASGCEDSNVVECRRGEQQRGRRDLDVADSTDSASLEEGECGIE